MSAGPALADPNAGTGADFSIDGFLGGAVEAVQKRSGHHRAGLEAVLLGAGLGADFAGLAVDLGAGAGVAGFCLATRAKNARLILVEREAILLDCARAALARPKNSTFAARVMLLGADISAPNLAIAPADAVLMNPPFHHRQGASPPKGVARGRAHLLEEEGIDRWFRAAASILKPGGVLVGIFRADALAEILAAAENRFGGLVLLPIHPRPGLEAHRLMLRAVKGSRAALRLVPGLSLHEREGNAYRGEVELILRRGAGIESAAPLWTEATGRGANEAEIDG